MLVVKVYLMLFTVFVLKLVCKQSKASGLLLLVPLSVLSGLGKIVGMAPRMSHGFLAGRPIFLWLQDSVSKHSGSKCIEHIKEPSRFPFQFSRCPCTAFTHLARVASSFGKWCRLRPCFPSVLHPAIIQRLGIVSRPCWRANIPNR